MPPVINMAATALNKLYKTVYLGKDLANQSKRKTPCYDSVVSKYDDFDGNMLEFPFNQDLNVSLGKSVTQARSTATTSTFARWQMTTPKELRSIIQIDAQSMKRARKDLGAWLRLKQKEMNENRDYLKMVLGGHAWWGDGAGDIAQVLSVAGGPPITSFTLVNKRDAVKFHLNQRLNFATVRTGGAPLGGAADATRTIYKVTKINRKTGVITVLNIQGAVHPTANDYVYLDSFYDGFPLGVTAFLTSADPGTGTIPGTLLGMDRTDDPTMKAGFRGDWQGSISETAKALAADMGQYFDSMDTTLWLSRYNWFRLEQEMESAGRVVRDQSATAKFGVPGIVLQTPEGDVTVLSDPYCPSDAGFFLNSSTWECHHLDPLIHIADDDGLQALRMNDDDGIEIRFRSWSENICQRPFKNGRFAIV